MRKGKVYPSSQTSTSSSASFKDPSSVLKLLPVTILALALSLPQQDLEVLAYLLSSSIKTTSINPLHKTKCRAIPSKKNSKNTPTVAKVPLFECGCFDCYISFWCRWDSSPNRELIHHVIEAFEEHLVSNESSKRHKSKRRAKVTSSSCEVDVSDIVKRTEKVQEIDVMIMSESESVDGSGNVEENVVLLCEDEEEKTVVEIEEVNVSGGSSVHRGLARKVLPDVVGLFNSRLWSLWSPAT